MRNISFGKTAAEVGTLMYSPIGPKRALRCDSQYSRIEELIVFVTQ